MEIEEIVAGLLDQARDKDNLAAGDPSSIFKHDANVLRAAADKIRQPNDPLTLDELREMDGKPVWVEEFYEGHRYGWFALILFSNAHYFAPHGHVILYWEQYEKTWLAYRRKPEGRYIKNDRPDNGRTVHQWRGCGTLL